MSIKTSEEQVKESVCSFYINNKRRCDVNYANATSKNIGKMYEDIVDNNVIISLFIQTSFVIITANKFEKNILHHNIFQTVKKGQHKLTFFDIIEAEVRTC